MARNKRRNRKRIAVTLCLVAAIPLLGKGFVMTIPYVGAVAEQAAFMAAGITLPEGGRELLASNFSEESSESASSQEKESSLPESSQTENVLSESDSQIGAPDTAGLGITQEEIDGYSNHDGTIVRKQYTAGTTPNYINISGNAYVKNNTNLPNETVQQAVNTRPEFQIVADGTPQVLIMHTHTTESYELASRDFFDNRLPSRTRDTSRNVVRVGDEIAKQFENSGIGVIHSVVEHDYPSYTGAYDRSKATVEAILKENPTIKVVLDVHRDAIASETTRYAPVAEINGRNAAQVMIISGCDDGTMGYPNYLKNLSFASYLQQQMESDYPGLTRPVSFAYKYYNQSLTTGSILLEMGGHANSLEEAVYAGELVGKSLVKALKGLE